MSRELFEKELQIVYDELSRRQEELNGYYRILEGDAHFDARKLVDDFLSELDLPVNDETSMAALTRLVSLREDALEQSMKKLDFSEEEIIAAKERAYIFTAEFYIAIFESFIKWLDENSLLTPFYRRLIRGMHDIGIIMNRWQNGWTGHILNDINKELFTLFNGDEEKIFEMLRERELLDRCGEEISDRCYSVLVRSDDGYRRVAYAKAFAEETAGISEELERLISDLERLDDPVYGQKDEWTGYFHALKRAFSHTEPDELIECWADVDRAWMKIKTPLQPGHPLEYYEDHYRKAVALEWDLRIVNPRIQSESSVKEEIERFAGNMAGKLGSEAEKVFEKNRRQIAATQLYIGRPAIYYGAEINGLFSAQVVPNDENVSAELGKKIFAYADFVRESKKARPVMQLSIESMGEEFVRHQRRLVEEEPELWNRIYEISTIGHEFGHILWMDTDTETGMNATGQFKNLEEFKATTGGLMAFFHNEKEELREEILNDLIGRAVSLTAWRETGEVLPYYCEGLIHLELLYTAGAIEFDSVRVIIDPDSYEKVKKLYSSVYGDLAGHYVLRRDSSEFLRRFIEKKEKHYMPVTPAVREFADIYYSRYREIGRKIATVYNR